MMNKSDQQRRFRLLSHRYIDNCLLSKRSSDGIKSLHFALGQDRRLIGHTVAEYGGPKVRLEICPLRHGAIEGMLSNRFAHHRRQSVESTPSGLTDGMVLQWSLRSAILGPFVIIKSCAYARGLPISLRKHVSQSRKRI